MPAGFGAADNGAGEQFSRRRFVERAGLMARM
jgi:hypothetical protein